MDFVKPNQLGKALGITTDALRKQRIRGSNLYDYEVFGKRVMYNVSSLPPSVREKIEENTTKKTRRKHEDLTKDHRYMHSLGKINEQRIKRAKKNSELPRKLEPLSVVQEQRSPIREPRSSKVYAYWTNPHETGNYWKSFEDYENSKKKKKVQSIY